MGHVVAVVDCSWVVASSREEVVFQREWNVELGVLCVANSCFLRCSPSSTPVQIAHRSDFVELSAVEACVLLPNALLFQGSGC